MTGAVMLHDNTVSWGKWWFPRGTLRRRPCWGGDKSWKRGTETARGRYSSDGHTGTGLEITPAVDVVAQ